MSTNSHSEHQHQHLNGYKHGAVNITHIRHGELMVLLEAEGEEATRVQALTPDEDGNWPGLPENARDALGRWLAMTLKDVGLGTLYNDSIDGKDDGDAPFRKPNGQPRELYPIGPSDHGHDDGDQQNPSFQVLYTVNLGKWVKNPWTVDSNLGDSITSVPPVVKAINERLTRDKCQSIDSEGHSPTGYRVVMVGPNWLGTGTNACACGAPGGYPVNPLPAHVGSRAFQDADVKEAVNLALERLRGQREGLNRSDDDHRGAGVSIAIIDSWPVRKPSYDFFAAVSAKVRQLQLANQEESAKRLERVITAVQFGGYRDLIKDTPEEYVCTHRHGCDEHTGPKVHANLADHGLFIAGIIHEIAPNAVVRVYRIFNRWGCSTTELVVKAVRLAMYDAAQDGNPLVINCSFTIGAEHHAMAQLIDGQESNGQQSPQKSAGAGNHTSGHSGVGLWKMAYDSGDAWIDKVEAEKPRIRKDSKGMPVPSNAISNAPRAWVEAGADNTDVQNYESVLAGVRDLPELRIARGLFAPLWGGSVLPVAAAGNDSCRHNDPDHDIVAPPRFPAAFNEVLGVSAAVPKDEGGVEWEPAVYSNNDDVEKMRDDAVSAMGGVTLQSTTDDFRAMIGPYVSPDLPGGNTLGHALWAGTSYSTPIVTALAACIWSQLLVDQPPGGTITGKDVMMAITGHKSGGPEPAWTPGDASRLVKLWQRELLAKAPVSSKV